MPKERIDHKERKGSTLMWFVIGLIPIVDLYFFWKAAEQISGHEKVIEKYEFLDHRRIKESTTKWFVLFLVPFVLSVVFSAISYVIRPEPEAVLALAIVTFLIATPIGLYVLWKMAEIVSGHEKIYTKYEALEHKEKKDSTLKWFVIGIIPIANLYLYWKVAEVISGHEKIFKG